MHCSPHFCQTPRGHFFAHGRRHISRLNGWRASASRPKGACVAPTNARFASLTGEHVYYPAGGHVSRWMPRSSKSMGGGAFPMLYSSRESPLYLVSHMCLLNKKAIGYLPMACKLWYTFPHCRCCPSVVKSVSVSALYGLFCITRLLMCHSLTAIHECCQAASLMPHRTMFLLRASWCFAITPGPAVIIWDDSTSNTVGESYASPLLDRM